MKKYIKIGIITAAMSHHYSLREVIAQTTGDRQAMQAPKIAHVHTVETGKHLAKDRIEHITLYSRASKDSDETIEREAILYVRPGAKATILICHGYGCDKRIVQMFRLAFNKSFTDEFKQMYQTAYDLGYADGHKGIYDRDAKKPDGVIGGYNIMSFDFRAHGDKTENQFCTFGRDEVYDVEAALNYLRSHPDCKDTPLIGFGFSMGAATAIQLQAQKEQNNDARSGFDALILDCPFASTDKLIEKGISAMKINLFGYQVDIPGSSLLKTYAYNSYVQALLKAFFRAIAKMDAMEVNTMVFPVHPLEGIKHVTIPMYVIGCRNDEKIHYKDFVELFENAGSEYKKGHITDGVRHMDSFFHDPEKWSYRVKKFIKEFLDKSFTYKEDPKIQFDNPAWEKELQELKEQEKNQEEKPLIILTADPESRTDDEK